MSTRGPPNPRGTNSRFAQFKLVLLGMLLPAQSLAMHAANQAQASPLSER